MSRQITVVLLSVATLVGGCAEYRLTDRTTVPAAGITAIVADVEIGDVAYRGVGVDADSFVVSRTPWGRASFKARAERRSEERNQSGIQPTDSVLGLWSTTDRRKAGVDWQVDGPERVDVDIFTGDGMVDLDFVEGVHLVTASGVRGQRIIGDADIYARAFGVDVEIWPYLDGTVVIESNGGDVYLALPFGASYNIRAFTDPDYGATVTDLGFNDLFIGVDYVSARTGRGDILIDVYVSGGLFVLLESR